MQGQQSEVDCPKAERFLAIGKHNASVLRIFENRLKPQNSTVAKHFLATFTSAKTFYPDILTAFRLAQKIGKQTMNTVRIIEIADHFTELFPSMSK